MTKALAFVKRKRGLRREHSSLVEERERAEGERSTFFLKKKPTRRGRKTRGKRGRKAERDGESWHIYY